VAGKGNPLVAWKNVTTPKERGGLGLKNMTVMNDALLTKHLHKLYNKEDVPWNYGTHTLLMRTPPPPPCCKGKGFILV
jgi:hypothetical protein